MLRGQYKGRLRLFMTDRLLWGLSETTIAGTPPEKAKARVCGPIQSGSVCVNVASA